MNFKKRYFLIIIFLLFIGMFIFVNLSSHSLIGQDNEGYVTKDVYSHYGQSNIKIAIITGMHPLETLSSTVVPCVIKFYALIHNIELTNYQVIVEDNPTDFSIGRANGQALVENILHQIFGSLMIF